MLTIGTKCSGFELPFNLSVIVSTLISKVFASSVILASRFSLSNLDGCIPTTDIVPSSANMLSFLSSIFPRV